MASCQKEEITNATADELARLAEMEAAAFAEYDAKAAALPYVPVKQNEDGLLVLADANFMETVNEGGILVVDCWMDNCYYCEQMDPLINQMAKLYAGVIRFAKLHNSNEIMTEKYRIQAFPTFVIFVDGKIVGLLPGAQQPERFRMILDRVMLDFQAKQDER